VTRVLVLMVAVLVAVPSAALSGCRLIGGAAWTPIPQLAAFAPWATIGWLVILLLLLAGRWWWFAAVIAVLLAVQVSWVVPTRDAGAARATSGERTGAVPVRVMTVNVRVAHADLGSVLRLAQQQHVDLLAVEEGQPAFFNTLTTDLAKQLPYVVQYPKPGLASGTVILSRWPLRSLGLLPAQGREISRVVVQAPGAVPVTVTGVHTTSPGRGRVPDWKRDLAALTAVSKQTSGPQLMLGDFNASRDQAPFRTLLGTGLVDAAEAVRMTPWSAVTWPANRAHLPAAVRLDHVLVTPSSVGVRAVRVREVPGSDHRAVLADLVFAAAT
jgi:endonuclease/exonuclease/phosphatase (EEP) superfamily protein YafD